MVADRGAAGGDQHVHAVHRVGDRGDGLARIGGDREHDGLAASGAHQGGERVRIGADDAAGGIGSPGMAISSPVARMATRGRRCTVSQG